MSKKKLDLNNLLAKYEGYSSSSNQTSRYVEPIKEPRFEEQFYQNKTYQAYEDKIAPAREHQYSNTSKNFKGNFVMSKSEIEQFLLGLKQELRLEERSIAQNSDLAIKQIHQNFQQRHEKLKRQILELLDKAFYENEKNIKEQLMKQSKIDPPQFSAVYRKISAMDGEINRLLNSLKGNEYRKAIAEVVTTDFNLEITELKANVNSAKINYIQSLGEIQPDRTRIESIKDNLLKLFYFNKKGKQIMQTSSRPIIQPQEESGFFSIFKDKTQAQNNEQPQPPNQQSRTRRSFFNFDQK